MNRARGAGGSPFLLLVADLVDQTIQFIQARLDPLLIVAGQIGPMHPVLAPFLTLNVAKLGHQVSSVVPLDQIFAKSAGDFALNVTFDPAELLVGAVARSALPLIVAIRLVIVTLPISVVTLPIATVV